MTYTPNSNCNTPLTNAVVAFDGKDRNVFWILGRVRFAILESDHPELAEAFSNEATLAGYDHLLATCRKYVTFEKGE